LTEQAGYVPPPGENADAAWRKLQIAIEDAKASIHKTA